MVSSKASQILFFKKYYFVVVVALCSVPAASLIFPVPREILTCSMCDLVPFSSCPQSLPASGTFQMSQLFASGCQSIVASASAIVIPMNIKG